jgi:8-hydroxy-5-deazaflavin:NADPH oxidoreductase
MTKKVAVVGGTGDLGLGLASRLARSYEVIIGSRDASRAAEAASKVSTLSGVAVTGTTNAQATALADVAILAIPDLPSDEALLSLKPNLAGKLVISPIVPMEFRGGLFFPLLASGSAAEKVASILQTRVAGAFHNVPAARLMEVDKVLDYDVLVAAETREIFAEASEIVSSIARLRPLYSGPLLSSRTMELLTPTLLNVGKLNKLRTPSVKVV